ncbi:hypothetical protein GCM10027050_12420 [Psychrosphaera aestuarii]
MLSYFFRANQKYSCDSGTRFKSAERELFDVMSEGIPKGQLDDVVNTLQKLHLNLQGSVR